MDDHSPTIDVGKRLNALRQEKHLSIRDVSRRSGISANAMSMIERGLTSPSVSTLYRLVDALGVPITALFRDDSSKQDVVFRRSNDRSQVMFPLGLWEGLGGEDFNGRVQPFMLTLDPGGASGEHLIMHSGQEFIICLEGNLEYILDGLAYSLAAGDRLLFAAKLQHQWQNNHSQIVKALIVLSGFGENESPLDYHIHS